ncbi:putative E3 ubiquitin-protein ligase SINA-like 9 [Mercurialis annua]|uniref:putative E3 ubiquitin-protein ligase SINA-like 9 n=1 Tax=Mercurialis annua TaxID=3986 RepID=UPI00215EE4A8|nr:putative E3 ubiquitin-protein ligase SINA-like 9 [Mercurialis annua]
MDPSFVDCSCPISGCPVIGSSEIIYAHCKMMHNHSVTNFDFDSSFVVSLRVDYESFVVLQENNSNAVFVLHNNSQPTGNILTLSRLAPSSSSPHYFVIEKKFSDGRCIKVESFAGNFQSIEAYNRPPVATVFGGSCTFVAECFTNLDIIVYADTARLIDPPLQDDSDSDSDSGYLVFTVYTVSW